MPTLHTPKQEQPKSLLKRFVSNFSPSSSKKDSNNRNAESEQEIDSESDNEADDIENEVIEGEGNESEINNTEKEDSPENQELNSEEGAEAGGDQAQQEPKTNKIYPDLNNILDNDINEEVNEEINNEEKDKIDSEEKVQQTGTKPKVGRPRKPRLTPIPKTRIQPRRIPTTARVEFPEPKQKRAYTRKTVPTNPPVVPPSPITPPKPVQSPSMPPITPQSKSAYKSHFDKIFNGMIASGMDVDQAKIYADGAAVGMLQLLNLGPAVSGQSIMKSQLDAELWTGYFSNQQQQQAISLLAQVPAFSGDGPTRFDDWIAHFESVMDTADWDSDRRIKLLCSKLTNLATDSINTFKQNHPIRAKSYEKIKKCLQDRFHGSDDRVHYSTEYKNCVHMPGESVRDYGCRLQKLFLFAYPMTSTPTADILLMREKMLMDKFVDGITLELRQCVRFKEYKDIDTLIRATERYAALREKTRKEKRQVEFVNNVSTHNSPNASTFDMKAMFQANEKLMSDMMSQTNTAIESLCSAFRRSPSFNKGQPSSQTKQPQTGSWNQNRKQNNYQGAGQAMNRYFCDYCNVPGHSRDRCFKDSANKKCYRCNNFGHFARECPTFDNQQSSQTQQPNNTQQILPGQGN